MPETAKQFYQRKSNEMAKKENQAKKAGDKKAEFDYHNESVSYQIAADKAL